MAKYIPTPHGFISNAPRVQFERCDGKRFYTETATAGSITTTDNTTTVYGGWGKAPLAFIDGDSSAEISVSDAMFQLNMFEFGGTGKVTSQEMTLYEKTGTASASGSRTRIRIDKEPRNGSIEFVSLPDLSLIPVDSIADVVTGTYYVNQTNPTALYIYFSSTDVAVGDTVTVLCREHTGTDIGVMGGGYYTVTQPANSTIKWIVLPFLINNSSVRINGTTPTFVTGFDDPTNPGEVKVSDLSGGTRIQFAPDDVKVGETVQLTYLRRATWVSVLSVLTTGGTARGSLTLTWPVMSSGTDCTQNSLVGFYHMNIPRVMVTQRPSLDTSRGTAATPQIVFSTIDAHRGDNKWYDLVYESLVDGMPSTNYSNDPFVWDI